MSNTMKGNPMTDNAQLRARLTIDILYDRNGVKPSWLMQGLEALAPRAAGEGLFTGDSEAEVVEWTARTEELPVASENDDDWHVAEILLHEVQWHYGKAEDAPEQLSEGDEDHIRDSIMQGYREGTLTYEGNGPDGEDFTFRGWWRIKK